MDHTPILPKQLMAGGTLLLALGLLLDLQTLPSFNQKSSDEPCQTVVQSQARLSRAQLAQLLTVPEGNRKQRVRAIVKDPFCKLADLQVRAGAVAQREAYPLEFDPETWLVVLYEGEQYVGYRFDVR
ncbi:hypothetical protein H6F43_12330 [Leptolyngbya sp. FACHB-36]|uniref:hypothetical protein n=1 Tax=Leptolyngbya sp. FACHB-36 TaxID=2692808 RepID=UPI0016803DAB|nr:hypothetical protein [Leptolyngbya sp. FACHB-36]MBD2020966.1 hypothetical protein [Leptolyngbya sp. FACHB-36]